MLSQKSEFREVMSCYDENVEQLSCHSATQTVLNHMLLRRLVGDLSAAFRHHQFASTAASFSGDKSAAALLKVQKTVDEIRALANSNALQLPLSMPANNEQSSVHASISRLRELIHQAITRASQHQHARAQISSMYAALCTVIQPDRTQASLLLQALARSDQLDDAMKLLNSMRNQPACWPPSQEAFSSLFTAWIKRPRDATCTAAIKRLTMLLHHTSIQPDIVLWTNLLRAFTPTTVNEADDIDFQAPLASLVAAAEQAIQSNLSMQPDQQFACALVTALIRLNQSHRALLVFQQLQRDHQIPLTALLCDLLVRGLCQTSGDCQHLQTNVPLAQALMDKGLELGLRPSVSAFHALIVAWTQLKKFELALQQMDAMHQVGVAADETTMNTMLRPLVLSAVAHCKLQISTNQSATSEDRLQVVFSFIHRMASLGHVATHTSFEAIARALVEALRVEVGSKKDVSANHQHALVAEMVEVLLVRAPAHRIDITAKNVTAVLKDLSSLVSPAALLQLSLKLTQPPGPAADSHLFHYLLVQLRLSFDSGSLRRLIECIERVQIGDSSLALDDTLQAELIRAKEFVTSRANKAQKARNL